MPLYEYRCEDCARISSLVTRIDAREERCDCEYCGAQAVLIISLPVVHLSKSGKLGRLDPKYDKMVDRAMNNTQHADPDRLLRKMKPLSGGE